MKIFITGVTGFVGGALANHFCRLGYKVAGIGRKPSLPFHICTDCAYRQADITKPLEVIDADIIIHAAGLASDTASFGEVYTVNAVGTQNVLRAAKYAGHFIQISSSSVYEFSAHAMKENEAGVNYERLSAYGKSKFLAEKEITNNRGIPKKTILRPRAIYGKYDQVLLPRLIKLVRGNKLFLPQNLSKKISLTHINNLIQAVELCLGRQNDSLATFNVADAETYDLRQILTTLLPLAAGRPLKIITIPEWVFTLFLAVNDSLKINPALNRFAALSLTDTAVLNIDRIIHTTGYNPLYSFKSSYAEIIHWIHREEGWKNFFKTRPVLKSSL